MFVCVLPFSACIGEVIENFGKRLGPLGVAVRELTGDMQLTKTEIKNTQVRCPDLCVCVVPFFFPLFARCTAKGSGACVREMTENFGKKPGPALVFAFAQMPHAIFSCFILIDTDGSDHAGEVGCHHAQGDGRHGAGAAGEAAHSRRGAFAARRARPCHRGLFCLCVRPFMLRVRVSAQAQ